LFFFFFFFFEADTPLHPRGWADARESRELKRGGQRQRREFRRGGQARTSPEAPVLLLLF
jgi:hypothetical protein